MKIPSIVTNSYDHKGGSAITEEQFVKNVLDPAFVRSSDPIINYVSADAKLRDRDRMAAEHMRDIERAMLYGAPKSTTAREALSQLHRIRLSAQRARSFLPLVLLLTLAGLVLHRNPGWWAHVVRWLSDPATASLLAVLVGALAVGGLAGLFAGSKLWRVRKKLAQLGGFE